jgi:hypothetical protein
LVTHADRAHVGEAAASVGSTVYDGDRLSTEDGGGLRVTATGVTLQLEARSELVLNRSAGVGGSVIGELASGTLVISSRPTSTVLIVARGASIRPAGNAPTIAHVRVVNSKELRISAQRGAVEFSYYGESVVIPEGKAYRVLLDPSEKETAAAFGAEHDNKAPPRRRRPTFLFVAVGLAVAIAVVVVRHELASPDRP